MSCWLSSVIEARVPTPPGLLENVNENAIATATRTLSSQTHRNDPVTLIAAVVIEIILLAVCDHLILERQIVTALLVPGKMVEALI